MNKVILIGNITKDPELSQTQSGIAYCRFSVAVNRYTKDAEKKADFFPVQTWRGLAENCGKFLKKGSKVAVEGKLENQSYEKDGEKKTTTVIVADNVEFLGKEAGEKTAEKPAKATQATLVETDEELPF